MKPLQDFIQLFLRIAGVDHEAVGYSTVLEQGSVPGEHNASLLYCFQAVVQGHRVKPVAAQKLTQ